MFCRLEVSKCLDARKSVIVHSCTTSYMQEQQDFFQTSAGLSLITTENY